MQITRDVLKENLSKECKRLQYLVNKLPSLQYECSLAEIRVNLLEKQIKAVQSDLKLQFLQHQEQKALLLEHLKQQECSYRLLCSSQLDNTQTLIMMCNQIRLKKKHLTNSRTQLSYFNNEIQKRMKELNQQYKLFQALNQVFTQSKLSQTQENKRFYQLQAHIQSIMQETSELDTYVREMTLADQQTSVIEIPKMAKQLAQLQLRNNLNSNQIENCIQQLKDKFQVHSQQLSLLKTEYQKSNAKLQKVKHIVKEKKDLYVTYIKTLNEKKNMKSRLENDLEAKKRQTIKKQRQIAHNRQKILKLYGFIRAINEWKDQFGRTV